MLAKNNFKDLSPLYQRVFILNHLPWNFLFYLNQFEFVNNILKFVHIDSYYA